MVNKQCRKCHETHDQSFFLSWQEPETRVVETCWACRIPMLARKKTVESRFGGRVTNSEVKEKFLEQVAEWLDERAQKKTINLAQEEGVLKSLDNIPRTSFLGRKLAKNKARMKEAAQTKLKGTHDEPNASHGEVNENDANVAVNSTENGAASTINDTSNVLASSTKRNQDGSATENADNPAITPVGNEHASHLNRPQEHGNATATVSNQAPPTAPDLPANLPARGQQVPAAPMFNVPRDAVTQANFIEACQTEIGRIGLIAMAYQESQAQLETLVQGDLSLHLRLDNLLQAIGLNMPEMWNDFWATTGPNDQAAASGDNVGNAQEEGAEEPAATS
ncbi:MAG: hypothetical protein M1831_002388 [Alyxoria varia]|nr:MAG: hypothetical protein M1831_002388 [Alyxoria varia]